MKSQKLSDILNGKIAIYVKSQEEMSKIISIFATYNYVYHGNDNDFYDITRHNDDGVALSPYINLDGTVDYTICWASLNYYRIQKREIISFQDGLEIFKHSTKDNQKDYCTCEGPEKEYIGFNSRTIICSSCGKDKR